IGGTINQAGTTTLTGTGTIYLDWSSAFNNLAGSTFDAQADGMIVADNGSPALNNAGTFKKSAGAGTTTVAIALNNSGIVQVQSGSLSLYGGTQTGIFDVAASTNLDFDAGSQALNAGVSF